METGKNKQKKPALKERLGYWFDNRMSKGSLGFIRILIIASILLAVLIAVLIICFGFNEEGETASVFWDSIATVLNAWMPYSDDGSLGYLILMSITAIAGVLFTSVLIGIITSAIEEKIIDLKRGNSLVLESDHIVVLGFNPGEYTLIEQLILAAEGHPSCLVLMDAMEREEMEQYLDDNLDIPDSFRIVCRTGDITDPASIEKCSVKSCRTVIISPGDDKKTVKAILAVSKLIQDLDATGIEVNAIISRNEYRFPVSLAETHNITTLQTNDILSKMIAHSCTQTGLSETFRELFNFEGSEFYIIKLPETDGQTFEQLMTRLDDAVPAGVLREGRILLNPKPELKLLADDQILVFSEVSDAAKLAPASDEEQEEELPVNLHQCDASTQTVIIGANETLPVIIRELPENVTGVIMAGTKPDARTLSGVQAAAGMRGLEISFNEADPDTEEGLLTIAKRARHIVVLGDHKLPAEDADMATIFMLLNLRDIRARFSLDFNITVELQKEHNQRLAGSGDHTDFLVASSMSSLILAQLSQRPELIGVFREILSNTGNELYLKNVGDANLAGEHSVRSLRRRILRSGYILFGYIDEDKRSHFNPPLDSVISLHPEDYLIVLGEI